MKDLSTPFESDLEEFKHQAKSDNALNKNTKDPIICNHCGRSSQNGIRCIGKCISDSDY